MIQNDFTFYEQTHLNEFLLSLKLYFPSFDSLFPLITFSVPVSFSPPYSYELVAFCLMDPPSFFFYIKKNSIWPLMILYKTIITNSYVKIPTFRAGIIN